MMESSFSLAKKKAVAVQISPRLLEVHIAYQKDSRHDAKDLLDLLVRNWQVNSGKWPRIHHVLAKFGSPEVWEPT